MVLLSRHLSRLPSALVRVLEHPGEYGSRVRNVILARTEHPRQHQRRLKPNEVDALAGAYMRGETLEALVEMFGIHRTTVLAHLKRRGLRRPPALTEAQVLEAARQYQQGLSLSAIARALGVSSDTVARQLAKTGHRPRPRH